MFFSARGSKVIVVAEETQKPLPQQEEIQAPIESNDEDLVENGAQIPLVINDSDSEGIGDVHSRSDDDDLSSGEDGMTSGEEDADEHESRILSRRSLSTVRSHLLL